jgi:hypothetical protein
MANCRGLGGSWMHCCAVLLVGRWGDEIFLLQAEPTGG